MSAFSKGLTCSKCGGARRNDAATTLCGACFRGEQEVISVLPPTSATPEERLQQKRDKLQHAHQLAQVKLELGAALARIDQLESDNAALIGLRETPNYEIAPIEPTQGNNEGTVVIVASDWHSEEEVKPGTVSGLNAHNLEISRRRGTNFWQSAVKLVDLLGQRIRITNIVVALLGDFITGQIHGAENAESNLLLPNFAIVHAKGLLVAGLEYLLRSTDPSVRIHVPCHSGNHARTTKTTRFTSENGHSLEYLMYLSIAEYFQAKGETRITFDIAEGMHSYLDIYGTTIRFHHGHAVKYNGGVGGLYIPVNKAIAQWNKGRHADLDVFGHFHQLRDGGNFICNGSLIGYNTFALSIKADYEPPRQALFLMDRKRGRTCTWPILVE